MLRGLSPLLSGDLLTALDRLGHGDTLAVVDANFPLHNCSPYTVSVNLTDEVELLDAIAFHLPLEGHAAVMEHPEAVDDGVAELVASLGLPVDVVSRDDFYTLARESSVVVRTRDPRPYGDILVTVAPLA